MTFQRIIKGLFQEKGERGIECRDSATGCCWVLFEAPRTDPITIPLHILMNAWAKLYRQSRCQPLAVDFVRVWLAVDAISAKFHDWFEWALALCVDRFFDEQDTGQGSRRENRSVFTNHPTGRPENMQRIAPFCCCVSWKLDRRGGGSTRLLDKLVLGSLGCRKKNGDDHSSRQWSPDAMEDGGSSIDRRCD